MAKFAVIDGENVVNTIIADSIQEAESISGKTCIEYTTEPADIGGFYINGIFIPKKPFPSWILENNIWVAPVPEPTDKEHVYCWDESKLNWVMQ